MDIKQTGCSMGHCKHGTFDLLEGCPQCIAERKAQNGKEMDAIHRRDAAQSNLYDAEDELENLTAPSLSLVKVRYHSETTGKSSDREYTYYTEDALQVGDIVILPVRGTATKAQVSAVNVDESEIAAFADKVKIIPAGSVLPPKLTVYEDTNLEEEPPANEEQAAETNDTEKDLDKIAVINVAPAQDDAIIALIAEAHSILCKAQERLILENADLASATDDLTFIAGLKKAIAEKRLEYVNPIKDKLDMVNDAFKSFSAPIDTADQITRTKILDFRKGQERQRAEAEAIERERADLAQREAALKGEEAVVEIIPIDKPAPVPSRVITSTGSMVGTMKVHKWAVEDKAKIPLDYLMIDTGRVTKEVKGSQGTISIPGIKIWTEETIKVGG